MPDPDAESVPPNVIVGPAMAGGVCARIVEDAEGMASVETWTPSGWRKASGAPDLAEVM